MLTGIESRLPGEPEASTVARVDSRDGVAHRMLLVNSVDAVGLRGFRNLEREESTLKIMDFIGSLDIKNN